MATYRTRRILPVILAIVIIIVVIAGLVALARALVVGGSNAADKAKDQVDTVQQDLLSTTAGRAVSMTVRGPIVADEDFKSYRIIVSPNSRQFQTFNGYLESLTQQETLDNNTKAYEQFVNALNKANMVAGRQLEGERNNTLGICATGKVYEFTLLNDSEIDAMFWTSTCGGSPGSLKGSSAQLSRLFLNQVPRSSNITASLSL